MFVFSFEISNLDMALSVLHEHRRELVGIEERTVRPVLVYVFCIITKGYILSLFIQSKYLCQKNNGYIHFSEVTDDEAKDEGGETTGGASTSKTTTTPGQF